MSAPSSRRPRAVLKRLWEHVPPSVRVKRARWSQYAAESWQEMAARYGLRSARMQPTAARPAPRTYTVPPWSVQDFLLLADLLEGQPAPVERRSEHIRASLVVVTHNDVDFTFHCLRSIMQVVDLQENEIIVVDNASSDQTRRLLGHLERLPLRTVHIHAPHSLAHAYNQGAALARGTYLVFLDQHTTVLPGWLESLVATIVGDDQVGAVGSMLIRPDGTLQQAGGIAWRDGSLGDYGLGDDAQNQRFRYAREVDYCSGAALLVAKALFDRLGGFDEQYAPAGYEDVDLCFALRSLGFKVVYQPSSQLVYHDRRPPGMAVDPQHPPGRNKALFKQKWRDVLERQHRAFDPAALPAAADRRAGPRILVCDVKVPAPDQDAGSLRMFLILKALARLGRPLFMPLEPWQTPQYEPLLTQAGVEIIYPPEHKARATAHMVDLAILSRAPVAEGLLPTIRRLAPRAKIIFDTVDLYFLRYGRQFELTKDRQAAHDAKLFKALETDLALLSDQVWCATPADQQVLAQAAPGSSIVVVPTIHALEERGQAFEERAGLLFIGGFHHAPNKDAVHFFVREIFPKVKACIPGVTLYVVGSYAPDEILAYNSEAVNVLGYVPDVGPLFQQCRVMVAPLRFGAGMKGKVGQALAHGLPVVTTTIGAEGIGLRHGNEALIADDPADFARAVVKVYNDREVWQRLSDHGYSFIEDRYTPQVIEQRIADAINTCLQA